jgi:hypothetical protein
MLEVLLNSICWTDLQYKLWQITYMLCKTKKNLNKEILNRDWSAISNTKINNRNLYCCNERRFEIKIIVEDVFFSTV